MQLSVPVVLRAPSFHLSGTITFPSFSWHLSHTIFARRLRRPLQGTRAATGKTRCEREKDIAVPSLSSLSSPLSSLSSSLSLSLSLSAASLLRCSLLPVLSVLGVLSFAAFAPSSLVVHLQRAGFPRPLSRALSLPPSLLSPLSSLSSSLSLSLSLSVHHGRVARRAPPCSRL